MAEPSSHGRPDFRSRQDRVREAARKVPATAVLITNLDNVFYLSGFTGSNGAMSLSSDGQATLVTDPRYRDQVYSECEQIRIVIDRNVVPRALQIAAGRDADSRGERTGVDADGGAARTGEVEAGRSGSGSGWSPASGSLRVAFEADSLPVSQWQTLLSQVGEECLVPTSGLVETRRRQKDRDEIALIESACQIAERALVRTTAAVRSGMTEREVARALDFAMLAGGADDTAFSTIVATGPNSAIPHHRPTERQIAVGDLLKIDFGALFRGYRSDITRTFVVGADPTAEQIRWHSAVDRAATSARKALRAGVSAAVPYRAAHSVLVEEGLAEAFTHGLGHGVGLVIHEAPIMTADCADTLLVDEVLTVEPGVYFPGVGGVRIEDTLVVADNGSRSLTTVPRDLVRLD